MLKDYLSRLSGRTLQRLVGQAMERMPPLVNKGAQEDKDPYEGCSGIDKARLALGYLFETDLERKEYWRRRDKRHIRLESHPFGLETVVPSHLRPLYNDVYVVGDLGSTEESVEGMLCMLHDELRRYRTRDPSKFRLRVIRAQISEDLWRPGKHVHWLYFELMTVVGTFLCGGCTDCSGQGNSGRQKLEMVFHLVAAIHDIPVEEIVIPISEAGAAIERLENAYFQGVIEKRQCAAAE